MSRRTPQQQQDVGARPKEKEGARCDAEERVETAAIWCRGLVFSAPRPGRHHDVIALMSERGYGQGDYRFQGFTTSAGRYVSRKEAWRIAEAAGQLLPIAPTDGRGGRLYSEDLW